MKQKLVRHSLYCGLITFGVCFFFTLLKEMYGLLIFSNMLPGFFYGWVLSDISNSDFTLKRIIFVLLSGGLFIFVALVATGDSFFGHNPIICLFLSNVIGSIFLLTLYYIFIDSKIVLKKGLIMALLIVLVSSVLPLIGDRLEQNINDYDLRGTVKLGFTFLIFPVWQTLFGWTICKIKQDYSQQMSSAIAADGS